MQQVQPPAKKCPKGRGPSKLKQPKPVLPLEEKLKYSPWMELPKNGGVCPYCTLNRSTIERLTRPCEENDMNPVVRSTYITVPGSTRGLPRFHLKDMLDYLERCSDPTTLPPLRGGSDEEEGV